MLISRPAKAFFIVGSYAAVLAFAGFLLFYHLASHPLWGDEAETAVLARNVVQFGVPRTYDGTNYILLHGTVDETPAHTWIWSPWLQEYFAATSFILFGPTTWAARAPFALVGWCSLAALGLVAWKIYGSHRVTVASVILLGTSEVFLLHARQCRYYAVSVFAEIVLVYGLYQLLGQKRRGIWLATFALILQFYSNYIIMVANLPALVCLAWLLRKQKQPAGRVIAAAGILLLAILPWLVYAHPWTQAVAVGRENYLWKAEWYLCEFHFHFLPLWFLLLPLLGLFPACRARPATGPEMPRSWAGLLLTMMASYLVVILIAPGFYLRYLLPVLPIACLLVAAWIFRYVRRRTAAVLLVFVLALSNALSVATAFPLRGCHSLRFPLVEYVRGLAAPYTDRFNDVLAFLQRESRPGQSVLTFDSDFPLMFYTRLIVINGHLMGPPPGQWPDWILQDSASGVVAQQPVTLPDYLLAHYEKITIMVSDSVQGDCIPEPDIYQYFSVTNRVPYVIYRLKIGPDGRPIS